MSDPVYTRTLLSLQEAQSDLAGATGGALGHCGGVGHVVIQMEEGPSADQVAVVEADCENLSDAAQQGALCPALTLDPTTDNVPETKTKRGRK